MLAVGCGEETRSRSPVGILDIDEERQSEGHCHSSHNGRQKISPANQSVAKTGGGRGTLQLLYQGS